MSCRLHWCGINTVSDFVTNYSHGGFADLFVSALKYMPAPVSKRKWIGKYTAFNIFNSTIMYY